jgi:membrane protein DedA with SNARE-associated domain
MSYSWQTLITYRWFIVASATIVGSTCSFLVSRYFFQSYVDRLVKNDSRFAALALTLKHDGIKLLIMIRLCPLPYSFSNGAISTIPTVTWQSYMFATALVTPKLLLHVFVGAKLGELAEKGKEMDAHTKMISYISIAIGLLAGAVTGWVIYRQTKARAAELEEQEREDARGSSREGLRADYADDPAALEAAEVLREDEDDISLRDAWDDDYGYDEDEEEDDGAISPYRDELSADEDAREVSDVFDTGDSPPEVKK